MSALPPPPITLGRLLEDLLRLRGAYDPLAAAAGFERDLLKRQTRAQAPLEVSLAEAEAWAAVDRRERGPVLAAARARRARHRRFERWCRRARGCVGRHCRLSAAPAAPAAATGGPDSTTLKLPHPTWALGHPALALKISLGIALGAQVLAVAMTLTSLPEALQLASVVVVAAALAVAFVLTSGFETLVQAYLLSPVLPLPDMLSIETQQEVDTAAGTGVAQPTLRARILLRHLCWVEEVLFDASVFRLQVVDRESFPFVSLTRRGLMIVPHPCLRHDPAVVRRTHELRVLLAAAVGRLDVAVYDMACGRAEDTDRRRKQPIGLSPRSKRLQERRDSLLKADKVVSNIENWRFLGIGDVPLGLLASEKVAQHRLQSQFKADRRWGKLTDTSADALIVFLHALVGRLICCAVAASGVTGQDLLAGEDHEDVPHLREGDDRQEPGREKPRFPLKNPHRIGGDRAEDPAAHTDADANTVNAGALIPDAHANGSTTTLRLLPSLELLLSFPPKVFRECTVIWREELLDMGTLLVEQLALSPDMIVEKISLLESLLHTTGDAMLAEVGLDATSGAVKQTTVAQLLQDRADTVAWLADWIVDRVFRRTVALMANSFVPDSQAALPHRDEMVRHTVACAYARLLPGMRETLLRDLDQRFVSADKPFRIKNTFLQYLDRMGIKMCSDTDAYGDERLAFKLAKKAARRSDDPSLQEEPRERTEWRNLLATCYNAHDRTLSNFNEVVGGVPVTTLERLLAPRD